MISRLSHRVQAILSLLLLLAFLTPTFATAADPTFFSDGFKAKWQRADKPVIDGSSNPARSWLWGPEGFAPPGGNTEPYAESPNGTRQVQYFDKARMELNDPNTGLVTNGLLVRELISGKLATGNAANITRRPADDIPVGGDPSGNNGPTYASFTKLASLNNDNPSTNRIGQPAADTLDKAGKVGTNADLGAKAKYVYFDDALKHNIPDVFWTFLNQKGNVYVNGALVADQPVLGDNPLAPWLDATGLPITDAYWGKVTVAGVEKDVLIQAFERRVLTYTPTNPAAFQVEMGNVGRHYYSWRYDKKYDAPAPTPTPTPTPAPAVQSCKDLPASTAAVGLRCGPAGFIVVLGGQGLPNEDVDVIAVAPNGNFGKLFSLKASPEGGINAVFSTNPNGQLGHWIYILALNQSKKELVGHVWLDAAATKPTIIVSPDPGKISEEFLFNIVGFPAKERVKASLKDTQGHTYTTGEFTLTSAGSGILSIVLTKDLYYSAQPGQYTMVVSSIPTISIYATVTFTATN